MAPRPLFVPVLLAARHFRFSPPSKLSMLSPRTNLSRSRHFATMSTAPPSASASASSSSSSSSSATEFPSSSADTPIVLPTNANSPGLLRARHTSAHVMAMAVQRLFPGTKVTIGPWIENGFYYDFDSNVPFSEHDLRRIRREMGRIIRQRLPLVREDVSRAEARSRIEELDEPYKLEILDSIDGDSISIYHIGDWWDLCAGPHVAHTGELNIDCIELEGVAGAYWRGNEENAMLQRIYGTCWETRAQLTEYLRRKDEAKKRDHRVLGEKLGLFSIQEKAGGGLVFWHPKGATVRRIIEDFWKEEHVRAGYDLLYTPHIANVGLWNTSGHLDFYSQSMFDRISVEHEHFQLKPMNCPFHCLVYKNCLRSYRELPLRWAELGTVYRYERSGTLHGLMRVRGFTQDDAHIFCLPEQLAAEIKGVLDLTEAILRRFGFTKYEIMLSTKPEHSVGSDESWNRATDALREALREKHWTYSIDEQGGAFYGPKIDIKIEDAIGRLWQCSTVQVDFNLPERFELEYADCNGGKQRPIMLHRAIYGSVERFFGVLVESYAGEFPLWLAPVQMKLLPVTDEARGYCKEVQLLGRAAGLRVDVDCSGDRLGKMVRNATMQKIPLVGVVGVKEMEMECISVRSRKYGEIGLMHTKDALHKIQSAAQNATEFQHDCVELALN